MASALRQLVDQLGASQGPSPSGMASWQQAVQNVPQRKPEGQASALRQLVQSQGYGANSGLDLSNPEDAKAYLQRSGAGLSWPFSKEQTAYLAAQFTPGAGMADASGVMPAMPESGQGLMSTAQTGQYNPSLKQNLQQGNYLEGALQGLGAIGDAAYAIPLAGLTVGNVLKAPRAIDKALDMSRAARMQRADEMGLNKSVFHGTHAEDITEIDPNEIDIGLHVGTAEQATNRLKDLSNIFSGSGRYSGTYREGANIMPLRVKASNPLEMSDVGDWKDSYQVLVGLRGNKAFAKEANDIEDMLQEAGEIAGQYAYGDELWRDSMENRQLLDEARSMIQGKGYDSVRYLNQVENTYGSEGSLTEAADAIIRDRSSAHDYLESQVRKRMPEPPEPNDPAFQQKIAEYLSAKFEQYASPEELQTMSRLREEISSLRNSPSSKNDPYSYIILDPSNIRSVNAAFDPAKRESANLMYGLGGMALTGGYARQQRDEDKYK